MKLNSKSLVKQNFKFIISVKKSNDVEILISKIRLDFLKN